MSELEDFIKHNREAFDQRTPDPAVLQRITQQMQKGKKKERSVVVPMTMVRWAAACIVLLAGATIFLLVQKNTVSQTVAVIPEKHITVSPAGDTQPNTTEATRQPETNQQEMAPAAIRQHKVTAQPEMSGKQAMFAKLTNMESTSQRLDAASKAYQLTHPTDDIIDALVSTMNNDPSTNVRLAALDALGKFRREAYVKKQLIASLKKQKDPMVQIGLIELLTHMREKAILTELDKLVNDNNTMDAVKDHAYSGILSLRS